MVDAVDVWFELIGDGPSIVMCHGEVCPTCGASWSQPGSVRLGGSASGTTFFCWSCMTEHPEERRNDPASLV